MNIKKMGSYRLIEHTADLAAELRGNSLPDLLRSGAMAWMECADEESTKSIKGIWNIELQEDSAEELLVAFVSELNYLLSVKKWICREVPEDFQVTESEKGFSLKVSLKGEPFDPSLHRLSHEIKAVTFHQMDIRSENGELITIIVFDI